MVHLTGRLALCVLLLSGLETAPAEDPSVSQEKSLWQLRIELGVGTTEDEALAALQSHAEQGDVGAQAELCTKYMDDQIGAAEAVKWCRNAAEHGHGGAQTFLGFMYEQGWGVPEDDVRAYAWFNIAAAQGNNKIADEGKKRMAESMTPERRARAQELARQYWETYVLPFQN